MFRDNSSHITFLFVFLFLLTAQAQHGEAAAPAGEAPAQKEFSGQQNEKWVEIQKSLLELKIKVDAQKNLVTDLLKSKQHNEGKMPQEEIETLKKEHERLQNLTKDYNQMLADFQFRFPEKGLEAGRKYIRLENQSLEDMENSPTLQGRLKKLNKKIKKQYQAEEKESKVLEQKDLNHKIPKFQDSKKNTEPDVTEKIIILK
jgi:hypothetical protein